MNRLRGPFQAITESMAGALLEGVQECGRIGGAEHSWDSADACLSAGAVTVRRADHFEIKQKETINEILCFRLARSGLARRSNAAGRRRRLRGRRLSRGAR